MPLHCTAVFEENPSYIGQKLWNALPETQEDWRCLKGILHDLRVEIMLYSLYKVLNTCNDKWRLQNTQLHFFKYTFHLLIPLIQHFKFIFLFRTFLFKPHIISLMLDYFGPDVFFEYEFWESEGREKMWRQRLK